MNQEQWDILHALRMIHHSHPPVDIFDHYFVDKPYARIDIKRPAYTQPPRSDAPSELSAGIDIAHHRLLPEIKLQIIMGIGTELKCGVGYYYIRSGLVTDNKTKQLFETAGVVIVILIDEKYVSSRGIFNASVPRSALP